MFLEKSVPKTLLARKMLVGWHFKVSNVMWLTFNIIPLIVRIMSIWENIFQPTRISSCVLLKATCLPCY